MLNVEKEAGALTVNTTVLGTEALAGRLNVTVEATHIETGLTTRHGAINVSIDKSGTGGTITVAAGVFTDTAPSLAKTASELLSTDDTNIITLGSDDKLFAKAGDNPTSIQSWVDSFNAKLI